MPQIHIGRGTTNLGVFEVEQVRAGLASGQFLLTDLGWKEGMETWRPLSEFEELSHAPTHDLEIPSEPAGFSSPVSPEPPEESASGLPWDHRDQLGIAQAYIETVKLVLTEPAKAFTLMQQEGGVGEPLLFALIGGVIGGIAALIFAQFFIHSAAFASQTSQIPPQFRVLFGAGLGLGALIWLPFKVVLGVFIGAAVVHVCLMLVGGAKKPFETTFRVLAYCMGATQLLLLVPICGGIVAGVWGLIVEVIGLSKAHEIQTGRALTAVLLPVICCCAFFTAAVFAGAFMQHSFH